MNQVFETIVSRRSCRSYTERPISKEDLSTILEAAINAPSGMNRQSWRFTVIRKRETMDALAQVIGEAIGREGYNFYNPNVIVLVSNDRENPNSLADASCAMQNIFLMAHSLGIASCWINQMKTVCDVPEVRAMLNSFGIPENHIVWGIADLGYATEEPAKKEKNPEVIHFVD